MRYSYDRSFPEAVFKAVWGHLPDPISGDRRKVREDRGSGYVHIDYEITGEDREGNAIRIDLGVMADDTPDAVVRLAVLTEEGYGDFGPKGTGLSKNLIHGDDEEFLVDVNDPGKAARTVVGIILKALKHSP